MKLPPRFTLTIDGTVYRVGRRHNIAPGGLPHLFAYLLSGGEVSEDAWEAFGLRVAIETDTDQGDDQPDDVVDWVRRQLPEPPPQA